MNTVICIAFGLLVFSLAQAYLAVRAEKETERILEENRVKREEFYKGLTNSIGK